MTIRYAVVVFPETDAADRVEQVRRRFDPLASVIDAHITLVFPFEDTLSSRELHDHVATALGGVAPFAITLDAPTPADEGYLFLRVRDGRDQLTELHRRLYSGRLRRHLSTTHRFEPHVTIGRLPRPELVGAAADEARASLAAPLLGRIRSVAVFRLADSQSAVDSVLSLVES